ncbi:MULTISPECIES: helix-turn-helix domain-containing protein [unclassified Halomonas]|uniref:helix-turn-helix domain-containing protein n=1 Tax=unclassified Halomonas TaxID=2609666 RepID=UPI001CF591F8|nr:MULTISPECIES: helix-turn-helix transcriptional regulator [unclassified Halomonas]MCA8863774.1 helix-turn-helix transcriptional regulator [Halomonas sp. SBBP1]UZH11016.1 helix-turn-helix transcriptional regulator [Halomonas sp. BDJS001]
MSQADSLIETLKRQLRAQDKTYADVAKWLALSEASVKRLFAEKHFTLSRLECICDQLNIEFAELVQTMQADEQRLQALTYAQEQSIVDDRELFLVAVCVINGYSFDEIHHQYQLSEAECIQQLLKLERLKLIELLPGNRIRRRVAANFRWQADGPIQRFFQQHIANEFFRSRFDSDSEKLIVLNGLLSPAGNAEWQQTMHRLAKEFHSLCERESGLPIHQRFGTTSVLAVRQWQYGLFQDYKRGGQIAPSAT